MGELIRLPPKEDLRELHPQSDSTSDASPSQSSVISWFAARDPRITDILDEYLPNQPELVAYIAGALRRNHGTLFTARTIGEMLSYKAAGVRSLSLRDVWRLGVHTSEKAMERLSSLLHEVEPQATNLHLTLRVRLTTCKDLIPGGVGSLEELEALDLPVPHGSQTDPADLITFQRIYLCALAMLAGVTINLRSSIST